MNTDFWANALVARMIEGMRFAVGPTIVARRRVLASMGGFDRFKDYLAEDFVMGKFAAEAGHGVILSSYVVEHHIGSCDLAPEYRPSVALGPQHAPLPPGRIRRPAVHHAISVWRSVCARQSSLVAAAAPDVSCLRALAAYTVSARVLRARINWFLCRSRT